MSDEATRILHVGIDGWKMVRSRSAKESLYWYDPS